MRPLVRAIIALALFSSTAHAELVPAPQLRPGQYVYTVPSGMVPPGFSQAALDNLNDAAKQLKYPFYVLILQNLPSGDRDRVAADIITETVESWSRQNGFDVGKSSVFLLSFSPRAWRFLAGSQWQSDLGLHNEATRPFTKNFLAAVQRRPANPAAGITSTMQAFDSYVWDQTDPVRIAARQQAAKDDLERKRLRDIQQAQAYARAQLSTKIEALNDILTDDKSYLPPNVDKYKTILKDAKAAYDSNDSNGIYNSTQAIDSHLPTLADAVTTSKSAAHIHIVWVAFKWIVFLLLIGTAGVLFWFRRRLYLAAKADFENAAKKWETKVSNASSNYASIYLDRDDLVGMDSLEGDTKKFYDAVTGEVNDIYLCIKGIEAHIERCRALAETATIISPWPALQAYAKLDSDFQFNTEQVNKDDLFGNETKVVTVNAKKFAAEQAERFKKCKSDWERLKQAAHDRLEPVADMFDTKPFEAAKDQAKGSLARWLSDHPYHQLPDVIKKLDAVKLKDPMKVISEVTKIYANASSVENRFALINNAIKAAKAAKPEQLDYDTNTVLGKDEDPQMTLMQASAAEDAIAGVLQSTDLSAPEKVVEAAETARKLYVKAVAMAALIKGAVHKAAGLIDKVKPLRNAADQSITAAHQAIEKAEKVHDEKSLAPLRAAIDNAQKTLSLGSNALQAAITALANNRHTEACRLAEAAAQSLTIATNDATSAKKKCADLDTKKKEAEQKAADLKQRYEKHQQDFRRYGGSKGFPSYQAPVINIQNTNNNSQRYDYDSMLIQMTMQETLWQAQVDNARRAQEAAERAAREAEEYARRRQREAEEEAERAERRRQDSYSSSSNNDSDGGSWGGGGGGSDGGGFGGGSSGSDGGGW